MRERLCARPLQPCGGSSGRREARARGAWAGQFYQGGGVSRSAHRAISLGGLSSLLPSVREVPWCTSAIGQLSRSRPHQGEPHCNPAPEPPTSNPNSVSEVFCCTITICSLYRSGPHPDARCCDPRDKRDGRTDEGELRNRQRGVHSSHKTRLRSERGWSEPSGLATLWPTSGAHKGELR